MILNKLIQFIDLYTRKGSVDPIMVTGAWGEGEGIEDRGIELVESFSSEDWLTLSKKIRGKSDLWIEYCIELLGGADTVDSRFMLVEIAFTGTDENFLDAMEWIRDFEEDVSLDIWRQLKKRSSIVLRRRLGFKPLA